MSYVADRNDIKRRWDEFWQASGKLGEVLSDAKYNSTFNHGQALQCGYLEACLVAYRYKLWKEISEVLEDEDEDE